MARNDDTPIKPDQKAASSDMGGKHLEKELYGSADNSAYYGQISQFMFWVATTIAAAVVTGLAFSLLPGAAEVGAVGAAATSATEGAFSLSGWAMSLFGLVSAGTMMGSVHYAREAARERQRNDTLYSVRQAEDNTYQLVNALEEKAKAHVMLKDAIAEPKVTEVAQPFERHYDLSDDKAQRHVSVQGENKPDRSWVAITGRAQTRGASQQWANYVEATQNVAMSKELS